jgi:hypothetical protein
MNAHQWIIDITSISRRAVVAWEGFSKLGVIWGLSPLPLVDLLHVTGGGFNF